MFDEEFEGLEPSIKQALKSRIEDTVRLICRRTCYSATEPSIQHFTKEELAAMLTSVFDLADRLRTEHLIQTLDVD